MNEIGLILPTFPKEKRPKRGAILASVLGGIASSIIGLAYEGDFYFNKTDIKPTVLDGRHQIILANWPATKR